MDIRESEVKEIISNRLGVDESQIGEISFGDLGATEEEKLEVMLDLEERFGLGITPEKDLEKLKNLRQVMDYVRSKAKKAPVTQGGKK